MSRRLFRKATGEIKPMLTSVEGISFQQDPLDFFILLARYKFAAKLIDPGDAVLDAGCGHGLGAVMLSKFAHTVTGVDLDGELVEYCRQTYREIPNLTFEAADIRDLFSLARQFDSIVCMDVIEHLSEEEGYLAVRSMAGLLSDRGMLIIGTPNIRSREFASQRRKATHLFEYDYAGFKRLLSGFFRRALIFSMTDEVASTSFSQLAWYFVGVCVK